MSQTFSVASQAELLHALSQATGGDVIKLQGGNYGDVFVQDTAAMDLTFDATVTIISADPNDPAVFSGMDVRGATNLRFDGVVFDYVFTQGDVTWERPFSFTNCANLTIQNSVFDGDVASGVSAIDDGYSTGIGLSVIGSTDVVIKDNALFDFHRGMTIITSSGVTVSGNDVHTIRSDGMDFAEVTDVVIEDNWIHDFKHAPGSDDHSDMIQFWTASTNAPSTDIIIRNNVLDIGSGDWAQSIFMRNEMVDSGLAGTEMFYRNVLIENNMIVNGHLHGITVGETAGLTIRNNSVLHADGVGVDGQDSGVEIPRITVAVSSTGVIITENLTAAITGWTGQAGWTVSDNVLVQDQDPLAAGYYADVFLASSLQPVNGVHAFILLPGSALGQSSVGADGSHADPSLVAAQFHVMQVEGDGATRLFDARFGNSLPAGTAFEWDFGDGTTANGTLIRHSFADGGLRDVTLTLRFPDGTVASASLTLGIDGPDMLVLGADGGFMAYDDGQAVALPVPAAGSPAGLQLGAPGVAAFVALQYLTDLPGSDDIAMSLTLKADTLGATGEVFRLHGSFLATVNATGDLVLTLFSSTGLQTLTTSGAGLGDLSAHQIGITLASGRVQITVDGDLLTDAALAGPLGWTGAHDLTFGNSWGGQNFNGDLQAFRIMTNASDYHATPETEVLQGNDARLLTGGTGNDVYTLITAAVTIIDAGGVDETQSSALSIDLTTSGLTDIENASLTGTYNLNLTGDSGTNVLAGNTGANTLNGGAGSDTLNGGAGADTLNGGAGADTMAGGTGSDTYIVNNTADHVVETATGTSIDTIQTTVSTTLGTNVENGILIGGADTLIGNTGANVLIGNTGANVLTGGAGSDTILGGSGNDTLNGGVGADTMAGGTGNDTYIVNSRGDRVIESGIGIDTVYTSINYTLGNSLENLVLTGTNASRLTGNALANHLTGNRADNKLDGLAGNDTLTGGGGTDTFVFKTGYDHDKVTDFDAKGALHDILDIRDMDTVRNFKDLVLNHMRQDGNDVVIYSGDGDSIRLHDVFLGHIGKMDVLI